MWKIPWSSCARAVWTARSRSFSAVISSTRKLITITPDSDLKDDTVYYVIVNKETLSDYDGNLNSRFTSVFSTGSTVDALIAFDPENKAENVLPDTDITISFAYALQRYGGATLRESYLESTAVSLRRSSSTGSEVEFTASLSDDGKSVTLTPVEELSNATTYYVIINENTLQYKDGRRRCRAPRPTLRPTTGEARIGGAQGRKHCGFNGGPSGVGHCGRRQSS